MKQHAIKMALGFVLLTSAAVAGYKTANDVSVGPTSGFGNLSRVRNSADTVQSIGCSLYGSATSSSMVCTARDIAGTTKLCTLSNPSASMQTALSAISGDSNVHFIFNAAGNCTSLNVQNGSYYEPKAP